MEILEFGRIVPISGEEKESFGHAVGRKAGKYVILFWILLQCDQTWRNEKWKVKQTKNWKASGKALPCQGGAGCVRLSDLIVCELHERGVIRHVSSGVAGKGTFAGLKEKIPHAHVHIN